MITIFTLEVCPNCDLLKQTLDENNITYRILDANGAEGITEMRFNGCFAVEMPVVMLGDGDDFLEYSDIFSNGQVKPRVVDMLKEFSMD